MSVFYRDINVTVTISNDKSTLDSPLIFYQDDFGLDINFKLVSKPFKFKPNSTVNILNSYDGAYVDVTIKKANGLEENIKNLEIKNGDTVVFTITKEMTSIENIGITFLQFHIGNKADETDTSYFSIPEFFFTVRKKLSGQINTGNLTYITDEDGNAILDENGEVMLCLVEE